MFKLLVLRPRVVLISIVLILVLMENVRPKSWEGKNALIIESANLKNAKVAFVVRYSSFIIKRIYWPEQITKSVVKQLALTLATTLSGMNVLMAIVKEEENLAAIATKIIGALHASV
jgi:hypothetical protein